MIANEKLTMRFEGENEIDLETLAVSLNATINSLKIIADQTLDEKDFCKFVVKSVEKGSFVIVIEAIRAVTETLFTYGPGIITTLKNIFEIRKFLRGEKPEKVDKEGNSVHLRNKYGENKVFMAPVYHLYVKEETIEKELSKLSQAVVKDSKRSGLTIETTDRENNHDVVTYYPEDLKITSRPIDVESLTSNLVEEVNDVWLSIRKTDFVGDTKWDFVMLGDKKISAEIADKEFLSRVRSGDIVFSADTRLFVSLIVRYFPKETDKSTSQKTKYIVDKVHKIQQKENDFKQLNLNFDQD